MLDDTTLDDSGQPEQVAVRALQPVERASGRKSARKTSARETRTEDRSRYDEIRYAIKIAETKIVGAVLDPAWSNEERMAFFDGLDLGEEIHDQDLKRVLAEARHLCNAGTDSSFMSAWLSLTANGGSLDVDCGVWMNDFRVMGCGFFDKTKILKQVEELRGYREREKRLFANGVPFRDKELDADPRRLALLHLERRHTLPNGDRTLVYYQGDFLEWRDAAYHAVPEQEVNADLANSIEAELSRLYSADVAAGWDDPKDKPRKHATTRGVVANTSLAMQGEVLLKTADCSSPPAWLGVPVRDWNPAEVLPFRNGLVHLPSYVADSEDFFVTPTPRFFSTYSLDYPFDPIPPKPVNFLTLIGQLPLNSESRVQGQIWRDGDQVDQQSIDALQEWFGYCLSAENSREKLMMWVGPKRSGKGTLAKVLKNLVGAENVAGPTLSGLATQFGLEPLIVKPVAIVDDARLSGRTDQAVITERILAITGSGTLTVDRKNRLAWTGRLPTRFTIISNEALRLNDASGALPSRMIVLAFKNSFYGREDMGLQAALEQERAGILVWAIEGWRRLQQRGAFVQPDSGRDLVEDMENLASPMAPFIRDCCEVGPGKSVEVQELFEVWQDWCHSQNHRAVGNTQSFSRDLRAFLPSLGHGQGDKRDQYGNVLTKDGKRWQVRSFKGLTVVSRPPSRPQGRDSATHCNAL